MSVSYIAHAYYRGHLIRKVTVVLILYFPYALLIESTSIVLVCFCEIFTLMPDYKRETNMSNK